MKEHRVDYRSLFTVALVRALDAKRLMPGQAESLSMSGSVENLMGLLRESVYRQYLDTAPDEPELQALLRWRRDQLFELVFQFAFNDALAALLGAWYDFHNIKVLLRSKIFRKSIDDLLLPWGYENTDFLIEIFEGESYNLLPLQMEEGVLRGVETYYRDRNIMAMDMVIDSACYRAMTGHAEIMESVFINKHISYLEDMENLRVLLRTLRRGEEVNIITGLLLTGGLISPDLLLDAARGGYEEISSLVEEAGYETLAAAVKQYEQHPHLFDKDAARLQGELLRETDFVIDGGEPLYAYVRRVEHELSVLGTIGSMTAAVFVGEEIKEKVPDFW